MDVHKVEDRASYRSSISSDECHAVVNFIIYSEMKQNEPAATEHTIRAGAISTIKHVLRTMRLTVFCIPFVKHTTLFREHRILMVYLGAVEYFVRCCQCC